MPTISRKAHRHMAIFLMAVGFLAAQFVFELGIVYGTTLIFDVMEGYLLWMQLAFIVLHIGITILLIALAKRIGGSLYKEIA